MPRTLAEQIGGKCVHFSGLMCDECKAGVAYSSVKCESKNWREQYPCFVEGKEIPCDKRRFLTPEEVAAEVAESEAHTEKMMLAIGAVCADAKTRGLKKGNGGAGEIDCPACKTGKLGYSVASYNGHIWGKCSTPECVAWMQ